MLLRRHKTNRTWICWQDCFFIFMSPVNFTEETINIFYKSQKYKAGLSKIIHKLQLQVVYESCCSDWRNMKEKTQLTEIKREVEKNYTAHAAFPRPSLSLPTHTHLSLLAHTHTQPHTAMGDLQSEVHQSTKSEKVGHSRFLSHFFWVLLFFLTQVWRGPNVLCLSSQWIMVSLPLFSSPPLSLSLAVCPWPLVDSVLLRAPTPC